MHRTLPYLGFGLLFLGCAIGIGVSYGGLRGLILENESRRLLQRLAASADPMDQWLAERKVEISTLALTPDVGQGAIAAGQKSAQWSPATTTLRHLQDRPLGSPYALFLLATPRGQYATSRTGFVTRQNIRDRAYFQRAIAGESYVSSPFRSRSTGKILKHQRPDFPHRQPRPPRRASGLPLPE